jgi:hypothetical protein
VKTPDFELLALFAHQFTWEDGLGAAEISDLQVFVADLQRQVWNDACDVGFLVIGNEGPKVFTLSAVDKSGDDVAGWRFVSADNRQHIVVFND